MSWLVSTAYTMYTAKNMVVSCINIIKLPIDAGSKWNRGEKTKAVIAGVHFVAKVSTALIVYYNPWILPEILIKGVSFILL